MPKQKSVGALVPPEAHDKIERFAKRRGANLAGLVRIALVKYMKEEGEQIEIDELSIGDWGGDRRKEPA
jgi:hypothetical protein